MTRPRIAVVTSEVSTTLNREDMTFEDAARAEFEEVLKESPQTLAFVYDVADKNKPFRVRSIPNTRSLQRGLYAEWHDLLFPDETE